MNTVDELWDCLAVALRQVEDGEPHQQVEHAIALVDELAGPALLEYPVCGCVGFQDRIVDHDCHCGSSR